MKQFSARNSSKYLYPGRQLDLGGFLGGAFLQEWKVESWNALQLVFFLFLLLLFLDHSWGNFCGQVLFFLLFVFVIMTWVEVQNLVVQADSAEAADDPADWVATFENENDGK